MKQTGIAMMEQLLSISSLSDLVIMVWNSELWWVVVAIIGPLIWRPIRFLGNSWRLHRRCQKYPHMVVCTPSTTRAKKSKKFVPMALSVLSRRMWKLPSQLFQLLLAIVVGEVVAWFRRMVVRLIRYSGNAIYRFVVEKLSSPSNTNETSSSATSSLQQQEGQGDSNPLQSKPTSALRQSSYAVPLSESSVSSSLSDTNPRLQVAFNVHSDGNVKTQRYYYDPTAEPETASVNVVVSTTPDKSQIPNPARAEKIQRIQTPPPRRARRRLDRPLIRVVEDKENATRIVALRNGAQGKEHSMGKLNGTGYSKDGLKQRNGHSGSSVGSVGARTNPTKAPSVDGNGTPIPSRTSIYHQLTSSSPAPNFSDQLRKRRLEGENVTYIDQSKRRSNMNGGRIALAALGAHRSQRRMIGSSPLPSSLKKHEREEREERILKDMNRKRANRGFTEASARPTKASNNLQQTPTSTAKEASVTTPTFTFGATASTPKAASNPLLTSAGSTPGPHATATATPSVDPPAFSFGQKETPQQPKPSVDVVTPSVTLAAPTPGVSLTSTPAATSAGGPITGSASQTFQFGSTPATTTGTDKSFVFGSTGSSAPTAGTPAATPSFGAALLPSVPIAATAAPGSAPVAPTFGAQPSLANPAARSTSGASSRRRRQGRRSKV